MESIYSRYRSWLVDQQMTEDQMSYKEWLAGTYPGDVALQNQLVVAEVVGGNLSRGRAVATLADVSGDADADLAAGLTALARTRMSRIANTMEFVDRVEDRLMHRINVEEASIDQLLAAGRLLRTSMKDDLTLVAEVVKARQEKPIEPRSFTFNYTENIQNIGDKATQLTMASRDSRDRTRSVLDGMIKAVNKNGNPADTPTA